MEQLIKMIYHNLKLTIIRKTDTAMQVQMSAFRPLWWEVELKEKIYNRLKKQKCQIIFEITYQS